MKPITVKAYSGDDFLAEINAASQASEEIKAQTSEKDWARLEAQNAKDRENFSRGGIAGVVDAGEGDPVALRIRLAIKARTEEIARS